MKTPSTIAEVLAGHAARDPVHRPLSAPVSTRSPSATWSAMSGRSARNYVAPASVRPRAIGIALQRGPEAALLNVAICSAATVLPFNPNLPPADLQAELKRVRLDALVAAWRCRPSRTGWRRTRSCALFKATKAASSFDEIALEPVRSTRRAKPAGQLTAQSWAAIFRTSGRPARPSACPLRTKT